MQFGRTWCVIVGLTAVAACSRQETLPCQPEARYSTARSAPPVQIPDDLSPPDESDAIRLPADVAPASSITAGECLETPPPFSGDSRPFLSSDVEEGKPSRRERREARRAERTEASAAQPEAAPSSQSGAAPPTQPDPPPANDDRVISN